MKYHLSKQVEFIPEWNSNKDLPEKEQVKFDLRVLSMGDVLLLMDTLEDVADDKGNVDSETLTASMTSKLVNEAVRLLPILSLVTVLPLRPTKAWILAKGISPSSRTRMQLAISLWAPSVLLRPHLLLMRIRPVRTPVTTLVRASTFIASLFVNLPIAIAHS